MYRRATEYLDKIVEVPVEKRVVVPVAQEVTKHVKVPSDSVC